MLLLAGSQILCGDIHDAVCVDIEGDLDLRHAAAGRSDAVEVEAAKGLVGRGHLALALEHVDLHARLVVGGGGEDLAFLHGDRRVAVDQAGEHAAQGLNAQDITITASTNLTEEEINQRVKEAEQYAEEDKKRREEVETLNQADSLIYETEKQLRDNGDKLSDEDKNTIQSEVDAFKKTREGGNAAEIKNAMEGFTQKVYAIFGKLYQQQGTPDMGQNPGAGSMNDDGTINTDGDVH